MSFEYDHLLDPNYDWASMHTKQIMTLQNNVRAAAGRASENGDYEIDGGKYEQVRGTIRSVLSTREHVPNKLEAKEARKLKAHQQRNH